tara:strand:- start:2422 stop:2559 length:138 start_codon:yes stop_codon:yes gene_type:complete
MRVEMFSMFCIGSIVGITILSIATIIFMPVVPETFQITIKSVEIK